MKTEEELLDLIDKLDVKIDEIDEQISDAKIAISSIEDEFARERKAAEILGLQRERQRINSIIDDRMKELRALR